MRLKAISPNHSVFVSASAGSGKTKILIDRLVSLLLHEVPLNKILCLAYTKAAASEIISRIEQRLYEFSTCNEERLFQYLAEIGFTEITSLLENRARSLFVEFIDQRDVLNIQTIHSFAQNTLSKFPFEAGVNFNFQLLDENKVATLIKQAKNLLIDNINNYAYADSSLTYLSWHMKEYSLNELLEEIIVNRERLDQFFSSQDNLEGYIGNHLNEDDFIESFIFSIPLKPKDLEPLLLGLKTDINRALRLQNFLSLEKSAQKINLSNYIGCFLSQNNERAKSLLTKKIAEENSKLLELMQKEQERVFTFQLDLSKIKENNLTRAFIIIAFHIRQIYKHLKSREYLLDYDDLISYAKTLLADSEYAEWIRFKLDGGIDHILVDEAQDTSKSQWQIINKIAEEFIYDKAGKRSVFIVGDGKQSIFSFQGAAPELFNNLYEDMGVEIVRLELNKSYRSGPKILAFVDKVFNQSKLKRFLVPSDIEIIHTAHKNIDDEVEIWPIFVDEETEEVKPWSLPSSFAYNENITGEEKQAKAIAEYIKDKVKNPGDVMILSRRRTSAVKTIIKELQANGIPVNGFDRLKLLEHPIICDFISLVSFILFNYDDFNLAIVLKSPICNLSEEELLELCYNREGCLWDKEFDKKLLEEFIALARATSVHEFFCHIIEFKALRNKYVEAFGLEANFVLDAFLELVANFEKDNISSLQLFLEFLNNTKADVKQDLANDKLQVKVMTVHAAKGLQAPIVILIDTTTLPSMTDSIVWLNEHKLIWTGKEKYLSEEAMAAKEKKYAKDYAEYIRLLYVALTRAECKLIIAGVAKNENPPENSWYGILKEVI